MIKTNKSGIYSVKELKTYNLNLPITYKVYKTYLNLVNNYITLKSDNPICKSIIYAYLNNKDSEYLQRLDKILNHYQNNSILLSIDLFQYKNYLKKFTDELLIITNGEIYNLQHKILNIKTICDVFLYLNEDYTEDESRYYLTNLKSDSKIKNIYSDYVNTNFNDVFNIEVNKKYNNVICFEKSKLMRIYEPYFKMTKIPNFIFMITKSLQTLNIGGNLLLITRMFYLNNTHKKIIKLLGNSFNKIEIKHYDLSKNDIIIISCQGFKDNISTLILKKLVALSISTRKYNYSLCQFMEYYYHIAKTKPDKQFMYALDIKDLNLPKNVKYTQTNMPVLDDININPKNNRLSDRVILQLEEIFDNYFDDLHLRIKQNMPEDETGNIIIKEGFIDKLVYEKLLYYIEILQKNNIPYNKTWLVYINKYNKTQISKLYTFTDNIKHTLLKYGIISKFQQLHKLDLIKTHPSYHYSELDEIHKIFGELFDIRLKIQQNFNETQMKNSKIVESLLDNYARGVSAYVMQHYGLKMLLAPKVSNGFIKLWEIYNTINIIPNKKKIKVFHLAEAPGQWINCTHYFILTKRHMVEEYDWRATSLNPTHPKNIEKYGNDIFSDAYGLIKKFKSRWIWGSDNTGDITKINNLQWYRQYCQKWVKESGKIDLVLGDGGIQSDDIIINQKLEYSQLFMVLATASYGSNCVIKHFLPYVRKIPISLESGGYFVNLLYLYHLMFETVILIKPMTSSPISGEFYVVGKTFRGLSEEHFNNIINTLSDFKPNQCIFPEKEIPEAFFKQVKEFNKTILDLNINYGEIRNDYLNCLENDKAINETLECSKYLDPKYTKNMQNTKFKEWVNKFNFE
jgi:hypothetical protein